MTKKIINPKDSDLFRQTVGEVRAVKSDKAEFKGNRPKPFPKPKPHYVEEIWLPVADADLDNVSHEDTLSYTAPGVQNAVLAKLRKGFFGVQAELDLHGLTTAVAKQQLLQFLSASAASSHRCVHIIHGKGYRSPENQPILKNQLNRWLRQHKGVQAFCSTPQRHGGAGAVFVLLKLSKDDPEKYS